MDSKIYLLLKIFDREENADAFLNRGEMYCRTLGDFKKIEGDDARGDVHEGAGMWHQPDKISSFVLTYKDSEGIEKTIELKDGLAGPLIAGMSWLENLNLYCMYAVQIANFEENYDTEAERSRAIARINQSIKKQTTISDEVYSFGEYAVVIYNVPEFVSKVNQTARRIGVKCESRRVQYFDPDTFHGSFEEIEAAFHKRNTYSHQNEYRFAFMQDKPRGALKICVGDLTGVAVKIPARDINSTFKILVQEKNKNEDSQ
jgi:hypothetical protein